MTVDAKFIRLGDLVDVAAGYPFRGALEASPTGAVAVVQMRDLTPEGIVWSQVLRTDLPSTRSADWLLDSDVLFAPRGERFFARCVGAGVPSRSAVCSPHLYRLRIRRPKMLLPGFLAWQLNQPPMQRRLDKAAEGTLQRNVRTGSLAEMPLACPALNAQQHIAGLAELALEERRRMQHLLALREAELGAIAEHLSTSATARMPGRH